MRWWRGIIRSCFACHVSASSFALPAVELAAGAGTPQFLTESFYGSSLLLPGAQPDWPCMGTLRPVWKPKGGKVVAQKPNMARQKGRDHGVEGWAERGAWVIYKYCSDWTAAWASWELAIASPCTAWDRPEPKVRWTELLGGGRGDGPRLSVPAVLGGKPQCWLGSMIDTNGGKL